MAIQTGSATSNGAFSSLSISGTTSKSGNMSWSTPTLPDGATITSTTLTATLTHSMTRGSATTTINGNTYTKSSSLSYDLGTTLTTSLSVTAKGARVTAKGTVSITNIVYTVNYQYDDSSGGTPDPPIKPSTNLLPPLNQWTKSSGITAVTTTGDYSATITAGAWWENLTTTITGISPGDEITISCSDISSGLDIAVTNANDDEIVILTSSNLSATITVGSNTPYTVTIWLARADNGKVSDISVTRKEEIVVTKPSISIQSQNVTKISRVVGYDQCIVTFTADQALTYWEARATTSSQTPAHGVGLLVESGTLAEGETGYIYVDDEELTSGDLEYRIDIYGQNSAGVWSDE